ncbi:hypothetical protein IAR55_001610 [Kwoniella newhampshirensis]|uniref:Uncharacterized protein n=1 Tax=Kwoniella newhampshirensis TaxID=1651941 RepID=A0AAW0Z2I5_9TREE
MPPAPSLDPYLRARATDPTLSRIERRHRAQRASHDTETDFLDFLRSLGRLVLTPITFPLHVIHQTLTSPLTLSLILKLVLLSFLLLASSIFSVLAVAAFFWSWSIGGSIEVEGWLFYGSKNHRLPHTTVTIPLEKILEDLRYDVQVEMELVRPPRAMEETGNFMLSLEMRSLRDPNTVLINAAQPSLPPPPLSSTLSFPFINLPLQYLPPCIVPWPFQSLCPSRLLGYGGKPDSKIRERRIKGGFAGPGNRKDVVPLRKDLMEGVLLKSSHAPETTVGSAFVSIGREDSFGETMDGGENCKAPLREVRTTGWVVVRFIPRPTGIRWLLASHPLPPLLLLPPVSLSLTLSSSLFAFVLITFLRRPKRSAMQPTKEIDNKTFEESLLAEKRARAFETKDQEEKLEEERRKREWDEIESSALGGLRKLPGDKQRESTVGGSQTTAPSAVTSFAPTLEESESDTTDSTETIHAPRPGAGIVERSSRQSSDGEI